MNVEREKSYCISSSFLFLLPIGPLPYSRDQWLTVHMATNLWSWKSLLEQRPFPKVKLCDLWGRVLCSPFLPMLTSNSLSTGRLCFIWNVWSLSSPSAGAARGAWIDSGSTQVAGSWAVCSWIRQLLQWKCVIPHPQQAKVRSWLKLFFHVLLWTWVFLSLSEQVAQSGEKASSLSCSSKRETRLWVWFPLEVSPPKVALINRWAVTAVDPQQWHCHSSACILLNSSITGSQMKQRCLPAARLVFHGSIIFSILLAVSV